MHLTETYLVGHGAITYHALILRNVEGDDI